MHEKTVQMQQRALHGRAINEVNEQNNKCKNFLKQKLKGSLLLEDKIPEYNL